MRKTQVTFPSTKHANEGEWSRKTISESFGAQEPAKKEKTSSPNKVESTKIPRKVRSFSVTDSTLTKGQALHS